MGDRVTIPSLAQMKREGRKSVGVVAWDYQIARIADRAGVDIVSVGDSVGVNLWGHSNPVLGGFGGGPWLDGRMRMAHTAICYGEKWLDAKTETYANVARISLDAIGALIADVRAGRQIKG